MIKTNLKALSREELPAYIQSLALTKFRAKQLIHWIYERRAQDVAEISEYSKELRDRLSGHSYISNLKMLERLVSGDGTEKYLWELEDGETIESVLIPEEDRLTLCISSQVVCALKCAFCLTGTLGLKRNLEAHEIVDQVISVSRRIAPRELTNIVLMGYGRTAHEFRQCNRSTLANDRLDEVYRSSHNAFDSRDCSQNPGIADKGSCGESCDFLECDDR